MQCWTKGIYEQAKASRSVGSKERQFKEIMGMLKKASLLRLCCVVLCGVALCCITCYCVVSSCVVEWLVLCRIALFCVTETSHYEHFSTTMRKPVNKYLTSFGMVQLTQTTSTSTTRLSINDTVIPKLKLLMCFKHNSIIIVCAVHFWTYTVMMTKWLKEGTAKLYTLYFTLLNSHLKILQENIKSSTHNLKKSSIWYTILYLLQ